MSDVEQVLQQWQLDVRTVRDLLYRAVTPRERERWHALWLLAQGWSAARVADALDRDPHTIGDWLADFRRSGPAGLLFEATGGSPPRSEQPSKRR
jgi:transposase